jgi:hypothetical protein
MAKNGVFAQTTANFCKNLILRLVLEEKLHFIDEKWRKF